MAWNMKSFMNRTPRIALVPEISEIRTIRGVSFVSAITGISNWFASAVHQMENVC
jgi:hypothetical protein